MKNEVILRLKKEILDMQGVKPIAHGAAPAVGLGGISEAFPYGVFPVGIHEFVSDSPECAAATSGFMAGLLRLTVRPDATCIWFSGDRILFPPGLRFFGIHPDRFLFVDSRKPADVCWMLEQALRCDALGVVIGEVRSLDLAQSRRLQLAAEQSRVSCFLHRSGPRGTSAIASVCRWKIKPVPGVLPGGLPGVGFPAWDVTLEKVRNGRPGNWQIQWVESHFERVEAPVVADRDSAPFLLPVMA